MKTHTGIIALGMVLLAGLAAPLASGASAPGFYVEVLLGGLMAGVLYSLVALGFVSFSRLRACSILRKGRWCCLPPCRWPAWPK